jgi:hypothetical protein
LISPTGSSWNPADGVTVQVPSGGTEYSGQYTTGGTGSGTFDLHAAQYVVPTDVFGNYSDIITFTIGYTP